MKLRDIILAIMITALWGTNWFFIKTALVNISPFAINVGRALVASVVALPFISSPKGHMKEALIMGILFGVGNLSSVVLSISYGLDISTAVILGQISVPMTCMLGSIFLKDTLGWRRITALIISFIGVVIFAGTPNISNNITGFYIVSCSIVSWSVSNVYTKAKLNYISPITLIGWSTIFSLPFLIIIMLYNEGFQSDMIKNASITDWGCLVYSSIFPLLLGSTAWQYLLKKYSVSSVAPFALLTPFFGTFLGVMVYGEVFTTNMIIGGVLIMVGVAIIVWRQPNIAKITKMS